MTDLQRGHYPLIRSFTVLEEALDAAIDLAHDVLDVFLWPLTALRDVRRMVRETTFEPWDEDGLW